MVHLLSADTDQSKVHLRMPVNVCDIPELRDGEILEVIEVEFKDIGAVEL